MRNGSGRTPTGLAGGQSGSGKPDPSRPHPFAHDVDPEAFYRSPLHESARAALVADAKTHTGFRILSGEPGTGTTAVLERVARDLEQAGVRVLRASALRPSHAFTAAPVLASIPRLVTDGDRRQRRRWLQVATLGAILGALVLAAAAHLVAGDNDQLVWLVTRGAIAKRGL